MLRGLIVLGEASTTVNDLSALSDYRCFRMKYKGIILAIAFLLLIVNTTYFWEGKLGLFAFPAFLLLTVFYVVLTVILFRQIILILKNRFNDKKRVAVSALLFAVLLSVYFKPTGFIDFDSLAGKDLLIAEREGGGNCTTTLKLKDNYTFRERSVCFGVNEIKGSYEIKGDSLIFKDIKNERKNGYYLYALIKPANFQNEMIIGTLTLYRDKSDSSGLELFIIKNDLKLRSN